MTSPIAPTRPPREQLRVLAQLGLPTFQQHLEQAELPPLRAGRPTVLQINVGKFCNQRCHHCHVDAGPHQTEANMDAKTFAACLTAAHTLGVDAVDLTGGAPELNPHFRTFVEDLRAAGVREIIDRCNLSVLLLPGQQDLAAFLAEHRVHVVASLPAVHAHQTDAQRGGGVFDKSLDALRRLNALGYGREPALPLTLVSNPSGAFLPPPQAQQEARFREILRTRYEIEFTRLIELANMPIHRFLDYLVQSDNLQGYMHRLSEAFNPAAVGGLMCRNTLSVGWDGTLYDCDFNQMLEMPVAPSKSQTIFALNRALLEDRRIRIGQHCLGCTAGQGSS